jgi:uncharacterized membrane protein YfcA
MPPKLDVGLLLIILGFTVSVIAGFVGVDGGFLVTPALIIFGFFT